MQVVYHTFSRAVQILAILLYLYAPYCVGEKCQWLMIYFATFILSSLLGRDNNAYVVIIDRYLFPVSLLNCFWNATKQDIWVSVWGLKV